MIVFHGLDVSRLPSSVQRPGEHVGFSETREQVPCSMQAGVFERVRCFSTLTNHTLYPDVNGLCTPLSQFPLRGACCGL